MSEETKERRIIPITTLKTAIDRRLMRRAIAKFEKGKDAIAEAVRLVERIDERAEYVERIDEEMTAASRAANRVRSLNLYRVRRANPPTEEEIAVTKGDLG